MPDETKLTPELDKLNEELDKIEKKKAAAIALGGAGLGVAIDAHLAGLKEAVGGALVAEAAKEAAEAGKLAQMVAAGQVMVQPGEDQNRIAAAEEEIQRIKDKLKKAEDLFDGEIPVTLRDDVGRIERAIPDMVEELGKAAVAAAEREVKDLKQEIDDLKKGKGKNKGSDKGPGKKGDDKDTDGGGGSAGGGSTGGGASGGSSGGGSDVDSIGDGGTRKEPSPLTIYVRSETSVWAWNRRAQEWVEQAFQGPIKEVKIISGGLLAIAEQQAALFDTAIGAWLGVLQAAPQELVEGGSS